MHPDGTIEFINKMNQVFNLEKIKIEVIAPYINYTSEELVNKTEIHLGILAYYTFLYQFKFSMQ